MSNVERIEVYNRRAEDREPIPQHIGGIFVVTLAIVAVLAGVMGFGMGFWLGSLYR